MGAGDVGTDLASMCVDYLKKIFFHVISSTVSGFILVARCFILMTRNTLAIAIATPTVYTMLYVTVRTNQKTIRYNNDRETHHYEWTGKH